MTAGVAAAPVMDYANLAMDPQLAAREFWILADHAAAAGPPGGR